MIFSPDLAAKITLGKKTVTRRPVKRDPNYVGRVAFPCTYTPGRVYAVQLCRGGTAVDHIRIKDVRRETLTFPVEWGEALAEGFDHPREFEAKWHSLYGADAPTDVWRIEFEVAE